MSTVTELERQVYGQQAAIGRCAFCPEYVFVGTADEVAAAGTEHRVTMHPDLKVKKLARGSGRPCTNGDCERLATVKQGRFAGFCSRCRDEAQAEEKRQAQLERAERKREQELERERKLQEKLQTQRDRAGKTMERERRTRKPKPQRERHPMHLATPERVEEMIRLYHEGYSAVAIGRAKWQEWGYRNANSLTQMIYTALRSRGIPRRSRSDSVLLTMFREGPRPVTANMLTLSLITDERLAVIARLSEAGCSVTSIARLAWEVWGYSSVESCSEAIRRQARNRGVTINTHTMSEIPLVSRDDAWNMIAGAN